jgi:hypothetical protein
MGEYDVRHLFFSLGRSSSSPFVIHPYRQFFVPGLAVPIVSTVAINNKVYFMDKKYDPGNTTGTYELDPSLVGAGPWMNAWNRT